MPAGPVVLNNTPLVALAVLGRLDLLRDLFGEVLIPLAVQDEFLAVDTALRREVLSNAPWIRPVALAHPRRALPYYTGLDQGEAEVLALAEECSASLVVIDEKKARRYAERMGRKLTAVLPRESAGLYGLSRAKGLWTRTVPYRRSL